MEEEEKNVESMGSGFDFLLFLILILLLVGNRNAFSNYFELFNKEVTRVTNLIKTLSATADGLQGAFTAPQKAMEELGM